MDSPPRLGMILSVSLLPATARSEETFVIDQSRTVKLIIAGAGDRGTEYSQLAVANTAAIVVGVADPREFYRSRIARMHDISAENVFADWREITTREKFADAIVIATQDRDHVEPAIAFGEMGYHMLLEKPMAPNPTDCRSIIRAAIDNKIIFAVCHVLRYTPYTQKIKAMIDSGLIGEVVCIQHHEPVGYWHQAHSFVRGNWSNEAKGSPMLLAKSCHDLDWIRYMMGARCLKVHSFGSLHHFRKENQPEGAAARCVDCSVESQCPYSAKKIYLGRLAAGHTDWPVDVLAEQVTTESITEAITAGPYGRCVYECDNDVVDNQVVNMFFEGGKTANFVMTAFNRGGGRKTRIFGTRGSIESDDSKIERFDFLTDQTDVTELNITDASILDGHAGGDKGLFDSFVSALVDNDPTKILSGPQETLETHMMVFAAEQARRENRVVNVEL